VLDIGYSFRMGSSYMEKRRGRRFHSARTATIPHTGWPSILTLTINHKPFFDSVPHPATYSGRRTTQGFVKMPRVITGHLSSKVPHKNSIKTGA